MDRLVGDVILLEQIAQWIGLFLGIFFVSLFISILRKGIRHPNERDLMVMRGYVFASGASFILFILFSSAAETLSDTLQPYHFIVEHFLFILSGALAASSFELLVSSWTKHQIGSSVVVALSRIYIQVLGFNGRFNRNGLFGVTIFMLIHLFWLIPANFNQALLDDVLHLGQHFTFGISGIILYLTIKMLRPNWRYALLISMGMMSLLTSYLLFSVGEPIYLYPLEQHTLLGISMVFLAAGLEVTGIVLLITRLIKYG